MRSSIRVDRNAGPTELLAVPVDCPDRDLELIRELLCGHPSARLEQEQNCYQSTCAHGRSVSDSYAEFMTGSVRFGS